MDLETYNQIKTKLYKLTSLRIHPWSGLISFDKVRLDLKKGRFTKLVWLKLEFHCHEKNYETVHIPYTLDEVYLEIPYLTVILEVVPKVFRARSALFIGTKSEGRLTLQDLKIRIMHDVVHGFTIKDSFDFIFL